MLFFHVNFAAQLLGNNVAEAMTYFNEKMKHPDFIDWKATIYFIKIMNNLIS